MSTSKVSCFQCKYFIVTWDAKYPRSCKFFGFKSTIMPSALVQDSTGEQCAGFEPKDGAKPASKRDGWIV